MNSAGAHIALVTLGRATFDLAYAREIRQRSLDVLRRIEGLMIDAPEVLVEPPDAVSLGQRLAQAQPDLLIVQNGTFALGSLAVELAQAVPAPLLLWAVKEPPLTGGTLRSNSLVGMHLNASNLYKLGFRPEYIYGLPEDEPVQTRLHLACRAAGAIRRLKHTRVGMVGARAIGFYNVGVNELHLRRLLGVEVEPVGLQDAYAAAYALPDEEARLARAELEALYPERGEIGAEAMEKMSRQFGGLRSLAQQRRFDALTVRCWPEWAEQYGIAACGSVSALNSSGIVTGCEGDVDGAVTMLLNEMISGQPGFMTDFISVDEQEGSGFFWHGGCAAAQLAADPNRRALNSHFAGGRGITAGFTFKPGPVTINRLSHDGQGYRMFVTQGEALPTEQVIKGVLMKVRFDAPVKNLLDLVIKQGVEHHFCVTYGDWREALELFAHWKGIPLLSP